MPADIQLVRNEIALAMRTSIWSWPYPTLMAALPRVELLLGQVGLPVEIVQALTERVGAAAKSAVEDFRPEGLVDELLALDLYLGNLGGVSLPRDPQAVITVPDLIGLGHSRGSVVAAMKRGDLRSWKDGNRWRTRREWVDAWLDNMASKTVREDRANDLGLGSLF